MVKKPPKRVISEATKMLREVKPRICGVSKIVNDFFLESHTLGCRYEAGDHPDDWWDIHYKIFDEYSKDGISTVIGDPSDGKFITLTPTKKLKREIQNW